MAFMLFLVQLIAIAMSNEPENLPKAFPNPEATSNVIYWIAIVFIFTALIFVFIKMNKKWMIQVFILISIISTLYYVFVAIFSTFLSPGTGFLLSLIISTGLTIVLYKFPEWYVIDATGVIVGAGASSIFGVSLAVVPTLLLLFLLAIYDYIAVYRTKHMIALAEGVMDLRLPILLIIPKRWNYSFLKETFNKEEREAFFMGLGDAVIPTVLVVSANTFVKADTLPFIGAINIPAAGAIIGTFLGFLVLVSLAMKGKPQAGLPFLNGGVMLGYVIGSLIAGSPML